MSSELASQLEKIMMAHTFLNRVDHLLAVFKTLGSGVEWLELATIEKECCQLYEQYKEEEWVQPFDVHFALVNPLLEFLMDDLMAEMILFEDLSLDDKFFFQHPLGVLVVERSKEWSEGCGGKERANCGDITEAGPLTPKAVTGGIAKGMAMLPRVATTPRSKEKEKGKGKA
ncbi:hypothetical protein J132_02056 [Termitomyces sp. J132]|nr:hypothetical protein J132_02056 [Termitomyces sp. J132]